MKKAVIILPTYNEEGDIGSLIDAIFSQTGKIKNWEIEILVVDSKSKDKTAAIVKEKIDKYLGKVHLLETEKEGLGKAYVHGFDYALNKLKAYVVFEMDADFSHPPEKIIEFLNAVEQGADFVVGSRYIKDGSIPKDWGFQRKLQSIIGNLIIRFGFMKLKISDWTGGYRAIKGWLVKQVLPKVKHYSGYVFQTAFLDNALKAGANIKEVPFNFTDRRHGISKINSVQYISQTLLYVFLNSSFVKFVFVGFLGFGLDFGLSYLFIEKIKTAVWLATLVSTETAIINNFILNNIWTFAYKKIKGGGLSYFFKFIKFNFVSLGAIIIQTIGISLAVIFFGKSSWYLYKILIIAFIVIPYSYVLYNKVVWKEK